MVALPLWGSVTSLFPPHLSPRPLLDGIFRRDRRRLLGKSGKLLACSLHLWDLSRPSSPECPFFASPALSLSWVHCGLSSSLYLHYIVSFLQAQVDERMCYKSNILRYNIWNIWVRISSNENCLLRAFVLATNKIYFVCLLFEIHLSFP